MYRALIADVDDTTVPVRSDGSDLDEQTVIAVARAVQQGRRICLATGRSWRSTKPVAKRLGITDPCIVEGGSCIIDPVRESVLWEKKVAADVCNQVVDIFKQYARPQDIIKSSSYPNRISLGESKPFAVASGVIYLLGVSGAVADLVASHVNKLPSVVAHCTTPSWTGDELFDVHVTDQQADKEHAVVAWRQLVGVGQAQIIALGDSANDLPLFNAAGLKIAVGNATADLRARADYIAPNQQQGALRHVIEKFLLA